MRTRELVKYGLGPTRYYSVSRQAYVPRIWPYMIPSLIFTSALILLINLQDPFIGAGIGVVVGATVGRTRWWIWRRRHPILSPEQWLDARRRAAPWN